MDPQVTQEQREQIAQQWRELAQAQGLHPDQIEPLAEDILSGARDDRVRAMTSQDTAAGPSIPAQSIHDPFHSFFERFSMPSMPMFQMPPMQPMSPAPLTMMPPMPQLRPMQFPMMPPTMGFLPFRPMQPMPHPPVPHFPELPQLNLPDPVTETGMETSRLDSRGLDVPQMSQEHVDFPGGSMDRQSVSFEGGNGSASFSYSTSSTSGTWGGGPRYWGHETAVVQDPDAYQGHMDEWPDSPWLTSLTPQRHALEPEVAATLPPELSAAVVVEPDQITDSEPQNTRLHTRFEQQLQGHAGFSNPPNTTDGVPFKLDKAER